MGCGDWNDGMNRVGNEGRGESVWLAFFLYDVLTQFAGLARGRNDTAFADRCLAQAQTLQGTSSSTLGTAPGIAALLRQWRTARSQTNPSARSIPCPKAGRDQRRRRSERSRQAMQSVDSAWSGRGARLIQLFDPPFDKSPLNPVISKATFPACARTAANTPTPRSGRPWLSR